MSASSSKVGVEDGRTGMQREFGLSLALIEPDQDTVRTQIVGALFYDVFENGLGFAAWPSWS